jgi:hypothetical protein
LTFAELRRDALFLLGTITTRDAAAREALLGLRRELAWNLEDPSWYGPHPPDCYSSGTRLRATHLFTTSDLFGYYAYQLDTAGRSVMTPTFDCEPFSTLPAQGDPKAEGRTGHAMPGGVAWFCDDNIPPSASNTRLIVARQRGLRPLPKRSST